MAIDSKKISITVSFYSTLRYLTGLDKICINLIDKKLTSLLIQIQKLYLNEDSVRLFIQDKNKTFSLNPEILVLVNDTDFKLLGSLDDEILNDGDNVAIISSVHGG
jgi:molybdopterin converting factor small subunit